jgi:chemotaxis response regulator CheB
MDTKPLIGLVSDHTSPVLEGDIKRAGYRVKRVMSERLDEPGLPVVAAWVIDCENSADVAEATTWLEPRVLALSNRPPPSDLRAYRNWCERIIRTLDRWTADLRHAVDSKEHSDPAAWAAVEGVWIMAGSTGAPGAVKRFLARFMEIPPVAFVYAQHMDVRQESSLTSIGSANPGIPCSLALGRHWLNPGQLLIAPASSQVGFNRQGEVFSKREAWETPETPSIEGLILAISGIRPSGIIMFSGAGSDGCEGLASLAALGARIWVQDPATCEAPSMPQSAIDSGLAAFVGSPEELADKLAALYPAGS